MMSLFGFQMKSKTDVLLTVDGVEITLPEFISCYNKVKTIWSCSLQEYFQYFLRYKMKVADARSKGWDSEDGFMRRMEVVESSLTSRTDTPRHVSDMVRLVIFTYRLPQRASHDFINNADVVMRYVHDQLVAGKPVSEIVSDVKNGNLCLEDDGGEWRERCFLSDEINSWIDRLSEGEISLPVYSPEGIHVIRLVEKKNGSVTLCDVASENIPFMLRQVEETLLVSLWDSRVDLPFKRYSDKVLEKYFKDNKKKYRWDFPHYKGAVLHCRSKKVASRLKKRLKKKPLEEWNDIVENFCEETREKLLCDVGLFMIGRNRYVDKLAFKCVDFDNNEPYPYTTLIGKCLDYEPECYKDVFEKVVSDYSKEGEKRFFEELEKKLRVEKHTDVLKTVNCSGSN